MSWAVCRPILWSLIVVLIVSSCLLPSSAASAEETVQLAVVAVDTEGNDVIGKYAELRQNGTFVASGFVPVTFVIANATEYEVGVADFKHFLFDHWQDTNSTYRWRAVLLTEDTELVAVYRVVVEEPTSSDDAGEGSGGSDGGSEDGGGSGGGREGSDVKENGSGGGGNRSKTVIILVPESGEIVTPTGISLSGITVGNPTSVEVAVMNPDTGVTTPYLVVIPRSPGDFSWWSYSLVVNDLAMTQIQVRALFSDGSQRVDTVDVSYYTGMGTNIGVRIMDSIGLTDVNADDQRHGVDTTMRTIVDTVELDRTDAPNDVNALLNEPSQPLFELMVLFLIGLAIAALLAWLAGWKRRLPAHKLERAG